MKKFAIGNQLTPYLILACALLAGILASQDNTRYQEASTNTSAEPGATAVKIGGKNFTAPETRAFSEIVERPLFIEGRRPLPPPVSAVPAPVRISPLRLQLEGVVITPAAKIAVLRNLNTNETLHFKTGMQHQGWELTAITETIATFKRDKHSQQLTLKK